MMTNILSIYCTKKLEPFLWACPRVDKETVYFTVSVVNKGTSVTNFIF